MFYDKYTKKLYYSINDYENRTGDIEHNEIYKKNSSIISFDRDELGKLMANKIIQPDIEFRIIF